MRRSALALLAVGFLLVSTVAPALAATTYTGASAINTGADAAHDPYLDGTVTKATHQMGWGPLQYENNDGEVATLPAEVNESNEEPLTFVTSDIEAGAFSQFPSDSQTESDSDTFVNANGWTTGSYATVSNTTTAPGVEAVQFATNGSATTGSSQTATFDGYKISSDAQKRTINVVLDVSTLDAGTNAYIEFYDTDGDYVQLEIDPDDAAGVGNNITNSTGEGFVMQVQVGTLSVSGSGDGTMDNLNKTVIKANDGDLTMSIAAMDVETNGKWDFGTRRADTDGDGDKEADEIYNVSEAGAIGVTGMDTLGGTFDTAVVHDLTVDYHAHSSDMRAQSDTEVWNVTFEKADQFPSYKWKYTDYRRLTMPSAYDLSYSTVKIKDTVQLPGARYGSVGYAVDVGTTAFSNISFTDASGSYDNAGDTVTLATGGTATNFHAVEYENVKVTEEEYSALRNVGSGGAPMDDSGGGLGNLPIIGGAITAILAFLGLRGGNG